MRFFIDEDLSPKLAEECHQAGYDASTVRDPNMLQASDREVKRGETHIEWLRVGSHEILSRPE